ncbi:hypothetical protein, partial [Arcobacter sp. CECT 8985]|uniref:hypothetical protein n=1 Tax=Arcobacter sp. CECT 8985 TaxID=1935424 RepID=UPI001025755A
MNKKILIVFPHNPFLLENGVHSRFYELIKYLNNKNAEVDILSHKNFVDDWTIYDKSLITNLYLSDFKNIFTLKYRIKNRLKRFLYRKNYLENFSSEEMKSMFVQILDNKYDFIVFSYIQWVNLLKNVNTKKTKKIIMIED